MSMKKVVIKRALTRFRAEKCGLKMSIYELLNELGVNGIEFSYENSSPKAVATNDGHDFSVRFIRLCENNVMEVKGWGPREVWQSASFGWNENVILDIEDLAMAIQGEDLLW